MNPIREFSSRLLPWVHPTVASLLRHAEGANAKHVERHLRRCGVCREQTALLAAASEATSRGTALPDLYETIELRMRAWSSLAGFEGDPRAIRPPDGALAGALEIYFGAETARRLQSCVPDQSSLRLLPAARPLFAAFLGQRAAESLARRIAGTDT